ncbi:uncharacterized protein LOC134247303 [Saccostrea cucullata]|uniref:uncharacterized protein LOC134247303 n=1 Tax=Saccostrea cuccullata TaxID=36930 RepID=UPI002ED0F8BC
MEEVTFFLYFCVLQTINVCTHVGQNQPRVDNDSFLLNHTSPLELGTEHLLQILPSEQVYTVKILPSVASRKQENKRVFLRKSDFTNTQTLQDNLKTSKREPKESEFVYGSDDRSLVENYKLGQYPYFNVVKLSSGCSGTLLTPSFILTAAHCVHDGTKFHERMELLKILIPHKMGYRLYYAKEIIVPFDWQKTEGVSDARRVVFDYAVIRLDISVFGRHDFSPLRTVKFSIYSEKLCFFAFPNNENLMWKSECNGWNSFPLFNKNVLLNKCDSARGNSGATILSQDSRHGNTYKIIGVLSSVLPEKHYTSFSLLTKDKISDICTMIHPEGKIHKICSQNESLFHTSRLYKG